MGYCILGDIANLCQYCCTVELVSSVKQILLHDLMSVGISECICQQLLLAKYLKLFGGQDSSL